MEKTRVIWFGSKAGSSDSMCHDTPLCWDQDTFTLLGIRFSTHLDTIINLNYNIKLQEIKALLSQWSKRNLTPLGRITVIKSLAIAKINHLFLSLPTPGEDIITQLNKMFYKYLWNGPIDRVKRDIVVKPYHLGGLKMLDIRSFIKSMKVSWIRRTIKNESKWSNIHFHMTPFLQNFEKYGSDYIYRNMHRINNPFWKDVYTSYAEFLDKVIPNNFK